MQYTWDMACPTTPAATRTIRRSALDDIFWFRKGRGNKFYMPWILGIQSKVVCEIRVDVHTYYYICSRNIHLQPSNSAQSLS